MIYNLEQRPILGRWLPARLRTAHIARQRGDSCSVGAHSLDNVIEIKHWCYILPDQDISCALCLNIRSGTFLFCGSFSLCERKRTTEKNRTTMLPQANSV